MNHLLPVKSFISFWNVIAMCHVLKLTVEAILYISRLRRVLISVDNEPICIIIIYVNYIFCMLACVCGMSYRIYVNDMLKRRAREPVEN